MTFNATILKWATIVSLALSVALFGYHLTQPRLAPYYAETHEHVVPGSFLIKVREHRPIEEVVRNLVVSREELRSHFDVVEAKLLESISSVDGTGAVMRSMPRMGLIQMSLSDVELQALRLAVDVEFISPVTRVYKMTEHALPAHNIPDQPENSQWNLDRVDARKGLNKVYNDFGLTGAGVTVYIVDTGINADHNDWAPGQAVAEESFTAEGDTDPKDEDGHGTHCAGSCCSPTYGIAKDASVRGLRVFSGSGASNADIIAAWDYIIDQATLPAVMSASLGGPFPSATLEEALQRLVMADITAVVAAGNEYHDANGASPAREPAAITVGATTIDDTRSQFSNYGPLVDIFAPGSSIMSLAFDDDDGSLTISGTSMACPTVAGLVALALEKDPTLIPNQVIGALQSVATTGQIRNILSPDYFMFTDLSGWDVPDPEPWVFQSRQRGAFFTKIRGAVLFGIVFVVLPASSCVLGLFRVFSAKKSDVVAVSDEMAKPSAPAASEKDKAPAASSKADSPYA